LTEKPLKQGQNDTPKTYIYDQPHSWLGTGTSIKSDGLKLVL
jgi:hypothetical protein